ncbi:MAG: fructosamine kinase family protein [Chloroflexi bacterium]|nr:fructosamine kinase family protein [Chloroflexota bacterium]
MIPQPVIDFCSQNGYGKIIRAESLGGGCINNAARLETENGSLFLKTNEHCPLDMFEREAEGLNALRPSPPTPLPAKTSLAGREASPRVPQVFCVGANFILLEYIDAGARKNNFWETLGEQLAQLHLRASPRFGFDHDNYIGSTPQINAWENDGYKFFVEHRLLYQADLARKNHLFDSPNLQSLISILKKLPSLIPPQPASLLHGDLWSGNIHNDESGNPVLIDPAAHYGWAEAELAMMNLFGSTPQSFFRAYESARPLHSGYKERFDLYNLYHLLNHANLFGGSYGASVMSIIHKYC